MITNRQMKVETIYAVLLSKETSLKISYYELCNTLI